jgi:hypothetical protein
VRPVELLHQLADDDGARSVGQPFELLEVLVHVVPGLRALQRRADEEGALSGRGERDQVACDGSLG